MAAIDDLSRFDDFHIVRTTYKVVPGTDLALTADFLVPKSLLADPKTTSAEPRPVILRFHGGYLMGGGSLLPFFFPMWLLQLAEKYGAIIVSPNYRLYPESPVADILGDIHDYWAWLHSAAAEAALDADKQTAGRVRLDLTRILTAGDSAGGYLSLMTALDHPDAIRAVTASYPMTDTKVPWYTEINKVQRLDMPYVSRSIFDDHVAKVARSELPAVATDDCRLERRMLMFSAAHNAIIGQMFDTKGRKQLPSERVEDGERFPRGGVFIMHGREDSMVPVAQVETLQATVRQLDPDLPFHLSIQTGEHGFDSTADISDPWMQEGLKSVVPAWLA